MSAFKDSKGREWTVAVTVGSVKRVKQATDLNLCDAVNGTLMTELGQDPLRFAEVLYHLLKPQADASCIDENDFLETLFGESLEAAYEAFCRSLIDFFQRPEHRQVLGELKKKSDKVIQSGAKHAMALIESATTETKIEAAMQKAMEKAGAELDETFGS